MKRQDRLNKIKAIKTAAIYYPNPTEYVRPGHIADPEKEFFGEDLGEPIADPEREFFGEDLGEPIYPPQMESDFIIPTVSPAKRRKPQPKPKTKLPPEPTSPEDPLLDAPDPSKISLHDDPSFSPPSLDEVLKRLKITKANRIERLNKFARLFQ